MKKLFLILIISILFFAFAPEIKATGASLYLAPSSGNYTVGNTFLVQVKINSGGVAMNAAEATLIFETNDLEVVKISKTDSVFSLWVEEPTYSNAVGTIDFAGGKPSPGYTGSAGTIISITFKAKTAGVANITFATGSVLADDGKGTNILTSMGSGVYNLTAKEITPLSPTGEEEYIPPATPGQTPVYPVISSPTHPDEDKWYSNNNPDFSWKLPPDITAVRLLMGDMPTSVPAVLYTTPILEKKLENLTDGIWYFHIQFKNQSGWGAITHRKVLIDTESPEPFEITVDNKGNSTNPTPVFLFESEDSLSGLEFYEVEIRDIFTTTTAADIIKKEPYIPSPLPPGEHIVEVKAFDKVGNYSSASTEFEILPIEASQITKIPISVRMGEVLKIEGIASPSLTVRIYIQKLDKEPILERVQPNLEGNFALTYDRVLEKGDYLVWAQSEDERGALSYPTRKYSLEVGLPPFLKFGKITIDYLTVMINLIILLVGAIAIIWYTWYRISIWRKRVKIETKEVTQSVIGAFLALRKEVDKQIKKLDKEPGLTKNEKEFRDQLKSALDVSEKFIGKEIEDIEKELE